MKKSILVLNLCLLLLIGCKEDAVTEPTEYEITISGKVVDEAEAPLGFCDISLLNGKETYNTSSDEGGFFTFSIVVTELDSFRINVQKEYYQPQSVLYSDLSEEEMKAIKIILPKTFVTISGALTELDENGLHSSVGTKVLVHLQNVSFDTPQTNTNENGVFKFLLDPSKYNKSAFDEIRVMISKLDFIPIDTLIVNSDQNSLTDISLKITKIVNYFPIKLGNRWEYESLVWDCETDYYSTKFEGTEIWEISSVELDGKTFTLNRYFTGTKKRLFQLNDVLETTNYENEKTSYSLFYNYGFITASEEGGEVPIGIKNIDFLHLYAPNGIYNYEYVEGDKTTSYTLKFSKGTIEYDYYDNRGWANEFTQEKLILISFIEGG